VKADIQRQRDKAVAPP